MSPSWQLVLLRIWIRSKRDLLNRMHKRPAPGVPITPMDPTSKFGLGSSIDSPYGPPAPNNSFYDNAAPSSSRNQSGSRRAVGPQLGFSSSSAAGRRFQPPGTSSSMNGLSRVPTVSAGYTFDGEIHSRMTLLCFSDPHICSQIRAMS